MQNPVLEDIFKELLSYDSVFEEILEQVEKAENNGTQLTVHEDICKELSLEEAAATGGFGVKNAQVTFPRIHDMQHPKKEKETTGCKQDVEKFKRNAGGEPVMEKDEEVSDDEYLQSEFMFDEWGIAEILRKCCNLFGKELPELLYSSARYLLLLGRIYLTYAADWDGLQIFVNNASELEPILNELIQYNLSKDESKLKSFEERREKWLKRCIKTDPLVTTGEQFEQSSQAVLMNQAMISIFTNLQEQGAMKNLLISFRASKKLKRNMEANNGIGIQQNLNFVKAAALTVGARVRGEIIKDSEVIELARMELCELRREIMKIDHVRGDRNVDICAFTEEIKRTLESYRREIAGKLESIAQIPVNSGKSVVQYAAKMREICEQCTEYLLDIMAKVAEKCVSIMGKPPCEFSIIGLGSLARKEVTLYSDFEHAIVLKDGIGDYSEAIEYFRWFSTIFQVIIIGLGETIIPSVGVKSLNDFYSSDERKDWFFDNYTPCGVSFDGMMPQACKIPLGRLEPTKRRSHTVELIQPVSKMVNFLTKDEEVKNGYFLSDILSRVCLIFGSPDVYDDYLQKSRDLVKTRTRNDIVEQQLNIIQLNPNRAVRDFSCETIVSDGKIKTSSYRPLTTLLSCAAALHSLSTKSSFEIVDELQSRGYIDNETHFILITAVATAMEIRLRTYLQAGNQRENVSTTDLKEMVGKERLINCYLILKRLKKSLLEDMSKSLGGIQTFISEHELNFERDILILFEEYEKALRVSMRSIHQIVQQYQSSEITALESRVLLANQFDSLFRCFSCFLERKGMSTQEQDNLISSLSLQSWKWLHEIAMRCCEDEWYHKRANLHYFLGALYRLQGKRENAQKEKLGHIILEIKKFKSTGLIDSLNFLSPPDFIERMLDVMSPDECLEHLNELLNGAKDFSTICCLRLGICQTLLAKGMKKQAGENLCTLLTDIRENSRRLGKFLFHRILFKIHELERSNDIDSTPVKKILQDITRVQNNVLKASPSSVLDNMEYPCLQRKWAQDTANYVAEYVLGELLHDNTHDVQQNNVLKASPSSVLDNMEYPYLQRKWADDIAMYPRVNASKKVSNIMRVHMPGIFRIVGMLREDFSAFSRKRIIQLFSRRNLIEMDDRTAYLMVLCEICHVSDLNYLINFLRTTSYIVTERLIIQPFLSALFADFLQRPTRRSMQLRTRDQLSQIASKQRAVIQALFRYSGKGGNLHNLAIDHFKEFRFEECARLSWKQLHRRGNNQTLQETSIKIFLTTTLATVVLQKRQSPSEYFEKTHEISLQQIFDLLGTLCSSQGFKMSLHTNYYWLYRYNFEDEEKTLVKIFNLAVENYSFSSLNGAKLLWRIVHAPNVTALIMKDSLHLIISCADRALKLIMAKKRHARKKSSGAD